MDGPKRLEFTTVEPLVSVPKKAKIALTHRFVLDLSDSTDTTCPEFFYTELLKTAPGEGQEGKNQSSKSADPFGEDDGEELAAIARKFEEKYGKGDGKKKKKKKWHDNYYLAALGDGYDENDTFIDNSEAYEEILPETMTTKLGGFYINSGQLEIKELSDSSEDEFRSPAVKKTKKKRRISSDEDSDGDQNAVKKKKIKDTLSVDGEVKKKKKKIIAPGEKHFKKPKLVKDKLKHKPPTPASPSMNGDQASTTPTLAHNGFTSPSPTSESENEEMPQLQSNVSAVIDSVIAMSTKDDSNSRSDFEEPKKVVDLESVPKLPPSLPAGMEEKVNQLKHHAKESSDGKCKFFGDTVNKLLLEVEMISKQMKVSDRSAIFGHLAAFLPCSKDTLLKRAKSLRAKELEDKIKVPLQKLKAAINRVMPALIEKYEEQCKKAALEKIEEGQKDDGKKEDTEKEGTTASDEEDDKTNQSDTTKKRFMGPRKKFVMDNDVRSLLCDVVRVKMHTCQFAKAKSQSAEEFCKAFLDQDVRPLWPKGWMQTRLLYKESKSAHLPWTNPQKPKKTLILNKMQPSTTPSGTTAGSQLAKTPNGSGITTLPGSVGVVKSTPISTGKPAPNSAPSKPAGSAVTVVKNVITKVEKTSAANVVHTPKPAGNMIIPTLLDYSKAGPGESHKQTPNSASNVQQHVRVPNPTPEIIRLDNKKVTDRQPAKTSEQSWDHKVSDILRSAIVDVKAPIGHPQTKPQTSSGNFQSKHQSSSGASQTKPQVQRQNSNSISPTAADNSSSYLAQFANFACAPMNLVQTSPTSDRHSSTDGAINLSTQIQLEKKLQQQKTQLELDRQRIKFLSEQQKNIENLKLLQQEQFKQAGIISPNSQAACSKSQGRLSLDSKPTKPPSQSPMSLAMNKNIPAGQSGGKMQPKQLSTQFQQKNMSRFSEEYIRQQLNDNSNRGHSSSQGQIRSITSGTSGGSSKPYIHTDRSGIVSSSTDPLRKTPPKPQTVIRVSQGSSQGKYQNTGSMHSVSTPPLRMHSPTHVKVTQPQSNVPATSLLKSLFGQAQSQMNQSTSQQQYMALTLAQHSTAPSKPQVSPQGQKTWNPGVGSSVSGSQMYAGTAPSSTKAYPMPVNARPVPGYQSVKLANLTPEQRTIYQAEQLRRAAYGKPSPGHSLPVTGGQHQLPQQQQQQQLYNNIPPHFGYHGYQDGTK